MKILGEHGTDGSVITFPKPLEVVRFGDTLRTKDNGMIWGIRDSYGDWVSPTMYRMGKKCNLIIGYDDPANGI